MASERTGQQPFVARLGLWDATSLIVGIIVGVGIYETPGSVFRDAGGPGAAMGLWLLGGLFSLVGAFCFAELASTYRRSGGEYVYLVRAFGPGIGFSYAWAQLAVIRTAGSVAGVAIVFANFGRRLYGAGDPAGLAQRLAYGLLAAAPIVVLTVVNVLGVVFGKWTQNTLTVLKVLGIGGILVAGFFWAGAADETCDAVIQGNIIATSGSTLVVQDRAGQGEFVGRVRDDAKIQLDDDDVPFTELKEGQRVQVWFSRSGSCAVTRIAASTATPLAALALAMILVMWTYDGWHEAAYVTAEVRNARLNLPRALFLGTTAVTAIYLLVNLAYLTGLGYERAAAAERAAADVLTLVFGDDGIWVMSLLVVISSLGALNGTIFAGSRIFAAFGADHPLLAALGKWDRRWQTPVWSLLLQGAGSVAWVVVAALAGENAFNWLLRSTAAVFWLFFLLTGVAFFVLRVKDPHAERPFRVPGYPATPFLFCVFCAAMLVGSIVGGGFWSLIGLSLLAAGVPLYLVSRWLERRLPADRGTGTPGSSPIIPMS
jgi:amino acid transporter